MPRCALCLLLLLAALIKPAMAQPVRIGGNGTFSAFMAAMAEYYRELNPSGIDVKVVLPPLGSAGGLKALSLGEVDIAGGIRPLTAKEREMPNIGGERRLGATPFVLVSSNPAAKSFSLGNLAAIYTGEISRWPDGSPIRLILRARVEGVTAFMRSLSPSMDAALDVAFNRKGMVIADNDLDTSALAERTPGSLAPSTLLLTRIEKRNLMILPLEQGGASGADAQLGLWMTLRKEIRPEVANFIAFLDTAAAREKMGSLGLTLNVP